MSQPQLSTCHVWCCIVCRPHTGSLLALRTHLVLKGVIHGPQAANAPAWLVLRVVVVLPCGTAGTGHRTAMHAYAGDQQIALNGDL